MTNNWGGKRPNAGRKPNYDEPVKYMAIPLSLVDKVIAMLNRIRK